MQGSNEFNLDWHQIAELLVAIEKESLSATIEIDTDINAGKFPDSLAAKRHALWILVEAIKLVGLFDSVAMPAGKSRTGS